jgi:hypothetical protein
MEVGIDTAHQRAFALADRLRAGLRARERVQ